MGSIFGKNLTVASVMKVEQKLVHNKDPFTAYLRKSPWQIFISSFHCLLANCVTLCVIEVANFVLKTYTIRGRL